MDYKELYNVWLTKATEDAAVAQELKDISADNDAIYDRFYTPLKFGTAGLRGVLGAGTNRMNIYVVRHATQGMANYIKKKYGTGAVAISHDSRINSDLFKIEAARVLAANGIKAYISEELEPTPVLSYLVRNLKCVAGIMITASHNPAKYNGYKAYGEDGCQMTDVAAGMVFDEIQALDMFDDVKLCDFDEAVKNGMIEYVKDSVYDSYVAEVEKRQVNEGICKDADLSVVYTPLNGAGNKLVRRVLADIGVDNLTVVKEQELPDGNFTTCPFPNPELEEALQKGLELCDKTGAELLLATDPDSDRVSIAARRADGTYRLYTGNEIGAMLTEYILSCRKAKGTLPENPIVVKTIVTTKIIEAICKKYDCEMRNCLTGFKYIGEIILRLEEKGEEDRFVFGFEESCGYLSGSYVRDKDAVIASMLICEMASYYKKQGKSLVDVIDGIYAEYGHYLNTTLNFYFEGAEGMDKMASIMNGLRENAPVSIAGYKVVSIADYDTKVSTDLLTGKTEPIDLPKSNVLSYTLEGGHCAIVRPSGTEPKIKIYITAIGSNEAEAHEITEKISEDMNGYLK
ncbi:phospho-sugar mutase [uncultured Ruminococcus sp.]|uniref:phospho-sugar mutase n=1 Tax=uncultured Ruminococcus sp. TaxID=165186 RepID=UPI00292ECD8F|nr:phospho-sugar mutase [uncultured Ruminococcus sp.]